MTSAGPFKLTTLPTELRHQILAFVLWTPAATLFDHRSIIYQDLRVRLRDGWDIWVPANPPQPAALPLLLTCRSLRDDVQHLNSSGTRHPPYEIDIVFIPKCGLFPTWICCPLPSQVNLDTVQASFRIIDVEDIDDEAPTGSAGEFFSYYRGISSSFDAERCYPNPPPASWNFYRLLASFLALGPRGLTSPGYQSRHRGSLSTCRRSLRHLIISVISKEQTEIDEERWHRNRLQRFLIDDQPDLPYGSSGEDLIFPGPPEDSPYIWTGDTEVSTVRGGSIGAGRLTLGDADRYGLYLANTLWALLDFKWLSRGFGLMVYEGILDDITFYVDGEPRPRFDLDNLLLLKPRKDHTSTPEIAAALDCWKAWVMKRRNKLRKGAVLDEPPPTLPFVKYVPNTGASYAPDSESDDMDSESGSGSGSDTYRSSE